MIIPSKHSGYQAGIRLYLGGGGGGAPAETPPAAPPPPPDRMASAAPPPAFTTYGQGDRTGSMVQSGNSYRPSTLDYSRPIYDPNYADNITGYQQSSQFYQPIYQSQYQNYARPATQFDTSMYGTQPVQSPASASGMSRNEINNKISSLILNNPNSDISNTLNGMRGAGINRTDIQQFGGVNNYGPQMAMPQMQTPFNPYTNQYQSPFSYQQPMQQARPNYGPSQAIVGRSSQMRGTPNVMRRAEGGITSLMDDVE